MGDTNYLPLQMDKSGTITDANTGILRMLDGKIFRTTDGGKTWTGAIGQADGRFAVKFADAEVGWIIGYRTMTYTVDGGRKWTSRPIAFPAGANAFCIVDREMVSPSAIMAWSIATA